MTVVSHCPHCGAPIYAPTAWWGIGPPPSTHTCGCIPQPTITWSDSTIHVPENK
jgi:hypothetical protein